MCLDKTDVKVDEFLSDPLTVETVFGTSTPNFLKFCQDLKKFHVPRILQTQSSTTQAQIRSLSMVQKPGRQSGGGTGQGQITTLRPRPRQQGCGDQITDSFGEQSY